MPRIVGAHLEEHARLEFAEDLMIEEAIEVVEGVAPGDDVDAPRRPFADDRGEVVGGTGVFFALEKP